jgi:hypothetical protein
LTLPIDTHTHTHTHRKGDIHLGALLWKAVDTGKAAVEVGEGGKPPPNDAAALVHVCTFLCVPVRVRAYVHACPCAYLQVCAPLFACIHVFMRTACMCAFVCNSLWMWECVCMCVCIWMCVCVCACLCVPCVRVCAGVLLIVRARVGHTCGVRVCARVGHTCGVRVCA